MAVTWDNIPELWSLIAVLASQIVDCTGNLEHIGVVVRGTLVKYRNFGAYCCVGISVGKLADGTGNSEYTSTA